MTIVGWRMNHPNDYILKVSHSIFRIYWLNFQVKLFAFKLEIEANCGKISLMTGKYLMYHNSVQVYGLSSHCSDPVVSPRQNHSASRSNLSIGLGYMDIFGSREKVLRFPQQRTIGRKGYAVDDCWKGNKWTIRTEPKKLQISAATQARPRLLRRRKWQ